MVVYGFVVGVACISDDFNYLTLRIAVASIISGYDRFWMDYEK